MIFEFKEVAYPVVRIRVRSAHKPAANHADILNSRYGVEVKGKVIVFNGMLGRDASRRGEPFAKRIVEESVAQGVSLMTGTELMERAIRHRAGGYETEILISEFLSPGTAE